MEARLATAERRARVVELKRQNRTFVEIGKELGVSGPRAHEIYYDALRDIPAKEVELHRTEATELAHAAIEDLLLIAREHKQPRTSVEAWGQIRGWAERLARIQGTDASTKIEATVTEMIEADLQFAEQIRQAEAEAEAGLAQIREELRGAEDQ